jgi:hypothetical protein
MTKRTRLAVWFSLFLASILLLFWYRGAVWPIAEHHPGLVAVLVGVVGEIALEWREMVEKRQRLKRLFSSILVLGLAWEFIEAADVDKDVADTQARTALIESNNAALSVRIEELRKTNAVLFTIGERAKESASQASEAAEKTKTDRVLAEQMVEEFRRTNLVLQAKVLELESTVQPRIIRPEQHLTFVKSLANAPKRPVWVVSDNPSAETQALVSQVRKMLDDAGYSVPQGSDVARPSVLGTGADGVANALEPFPRGMSSIDAFVVLAFNAKDFEFFKVPPKFGLLPESPTNEPPHGMALYNAFNAAGIKMVAVPAIGLVESGEVAVIVPGKKQF